MAKLLKDILKQAHDTIKGVHKSTTEPLSIGKDPGVDYKPKAGDEDDFVAKHSVQKWDEPYGNPNYADKVGYVLKRPEEKRHGNTETKAKATNEEIQIDEISKKLAKSYTQKASEYADNNYENEFDDPSVTRKLDNRERGIRNASMKRLGSKYAKVPATEEVSESKKAEDVSCNHTPAGTKCPVHDMAECTYSRTIKETEQIDELSSGTYKRAMKKAAYKAMWDPEGETGKTYKKYSTMAKKFRSKGMEQERKEKAIKEDVQPGQFVQPSSAAKAKIKQIQQKDADKAAIGRAKMGIDEKHLTPAELKKREEIAQAIHRKTPSMPMSKKMAIATATAKKVAECAVEPLLGENEPPRGYSDEAAEMVKTELKALANKAMHLVMAMPDNMHVEPWVQAKIAQAKELVSGVHDYMVYSDHDKDEDEGTMDTPMTFPGMNTDNALGQNV